MRTQEKARNIGIWDLVLLMYTPIIFFSFFIILPKVKLDYLFESQKTKLGRHHEESEKLGYPGIPYIANTGTSKFIFVSKKDIAYGECGWNFYCVPEELNTKKGTHYLPLTYPLKRIRNNVVRVNNQYYCNSLDIDGAGKCTSRGWKYGTER